MDKDLAKMLCNINTGLKAIFNCITDIAPETLNPQQQDSFRTALEYIKLMDTRLEILKKEIDNG